MKIIDAHMHYFNIEGFKTVAANAGYENTAACWQQICEENNIVFSVAMGNTEDVPSRYGGISPRLIDLNAPFDDVRLLWKMPGKQRLNLNIMRKSRSVSA